MTIREYNAMRHRLATSAPFQAGERVEIFGTPFESINGKLGTVAEVVRQKAPRPHWRAGVNFDDGCSDSFDCFYLITAEPER